jgi:hypothetical protein
MVWMAKEKKRVLGEVAAYQIAWIRKMLGDDSDFDVERLNPYGALPAPPPETTEDDKQLFRGALRKFAGLKGPPRGAAGNRGE